MSLLSRSLWVKPSALQSKKQIWDPFSLAALLWSCGNMKTVLPTSCQRCECYPLMASSSSASPRPSSLTSVTTVIIQQKQCEKEAQTAAVFSTKDKFHPKKQRCPFCNFLQCHTARGSPPIQASCCPRFASSCLPKNWGPRT